MLVVVIWSSSVSIARHSREWFAGGDGPLPGSRRPVGPARALLPQCPDPYNANDAAVLVSSVAGRNRGAGVQPPGGWEWHP